LGTRRGSHCGLPSSELGERQAGSSASRLQLGSSSVVKERAPKTSLGSCRVWRDGTSERRNQEWSGRSSSTFSLSSANFSPWQSDFFRDFLRGFARETRILFAAAKVNVFAPRKWSLRAVSLENWRPSRLLEPSTRGLQRPALSTVTPKKESFFPLLLERKRRGKTREISGPLPFCFLLSLSKVKSKEEF
jgi:hypothetical protein